MRTSHKFTLAATLLAIAGAAAAQVVFYENEDFRGRSFSAEGAVQNFANHGFNDRASSIRVERGNWQVCENSEFAGRCVMLRPGGYPTLAAMGLQDRVSSVRRVSDDRDARDNNRGNGNGNGYGYGNERDNGSAQWQRRGNERLYEANVQSVRAVMGPPEQRCWVERQTVEVERRDNRAPGAVVGAVIGGILGHQIGSGSGRDIATVGGVVAGTAVGSQIGRNRDGPELATQDVRRCGDAPGARRTDYWDVTYNFRGQDHRVQMSQPPGPTITVNRQGEPRT